MGSGGAAMGLGVVTSLYGASKQADAAENAGRAQEAAAAQQLALARESRDMAIEAARSPEQIAALNRQLGQRDKQLRRQEEFLSKIDPTLIESSQQALKLLRGQEAQSLAPIKAQRNRQRKLMLDSLREQLGPGAETSTAGIQALTKFDQETAQVLGGAQQQSLGMLLGSTQASAGMGRQQLQSLNQYGLGISGQFGDIASRRTNAITGSHNAITSGSQAVTNAAGGRFAGDQIWGQAIGGVGNALFQYGAEDSQSTKKMIAGAAGGGG